MTTAWSSASRLRQNITSYHGRSRSQRRLRLVQNLLSNLRIIGVLCEDLVADVDRLHKPGVGCSQKAEREGKQNRFFTQFFVESKIVTPSFHVFRDRGTRAAIGTGSTSWLFCFQMTGGGGLNPKSSESPFFLCQYGVFFT